MSRCRQSIRSFGFQIVSQEPGAFKKISKRPVGCLFGGRSLNRLLAFVIVPLLLCSCTASHFNGGLPSSGSGSVRKRMISSGAPLTTSQADALIGISAAASDRKLLREFILEAPYAESIYAMHGNVDVVLYDADTNSFITNKRGLENAFHVRSDGGAPVTGSGMNFAGL